MIALLAVLSLSNRGARVPGGLVGLGLGMAGMTLYAATGCPGYLGLPSAECSAPDLRPVVVLAAFMASVGIALTYRRARQS